MLLPNDTAAIQNSRLMPHAQSAINGVASVRTAILATSQYQSYTVNGNTTLLSFTFPAGTVIAGNQVRMHVYGVATNSSASNKSFTPSTYVTQTTSQVSSAVLFQIPPGVEYPFTIDGAISFNTPGPANSFDPSFSTPVASAKPNDMLAVGSMVEIRMRTATTTITEDMAVVSDPNALVIDNYNPVGVTLQLNTGTDVTFTIAGGWIEAM